MKEEERLKKIIEKQRKILLSFGYPEKKPVPVADPKYWKAKYKSLMDEKIKLERKYGELWETAKSVVRENNIGIGKHKNIQGPTGEFLFPGEGEVSKLVETYKPFGNVF